MIAGAGIAYIVIGLLCATWALQAWWAESSFWKRVLYAAALLINVLLPSRVAAVLLMGVLPQ